MNAQDIKERNNIIKRAKQFEELLSTLSTKFINLPPDQIDTKIKEALKLMGS